MNNLYILCGPSGSGKTTLAEGLEKFHGASLITSYTDRPRRDEGEYNHIFIPSDMFSKLPSKLAYHEHYGYRYCVTREQLMRFDIGVFDPSGIRDILRNFRERNIVVIGLTIDPPEAFERMIERGDDVKDAARRLKMDALMFNKFEELCDVTFNAGQSKEKLREKVWSYIMTNEARKV